MDYICRSGHLLFIFFIYRNYGVSSMNATLWKFILNLVIF
jgi:hypothetical protein